MKVLITGAEGFVGTYMAEFLIDKCVEIYGTAWRRASLTSLEHIKDKITLFTGDIIDEGFLERIIKEVMPERIIHLAAQSHVHTSWKDPANTIITNTVGTLNLFLAVIEAGYNPRILSACAANEYGLTTEDDIPLTEKTVLKPLNPYAVSKVAVDMLGFLYAKSPAHRLNIINVRPFSHIGPRQDEKFASSAFARQIALIEKGLQEPVIRVGNLEPKRDFTDVRDVIEAYWLALEKAIPGEVYNICSENAYSIRELLNLLLSMAKVNIEVRQDPERMVPSDVPIIVGACTKFKILTGWKPRIPFEKTLEDILTYWRERV